MFATNTAPRLAADIIRQTTEPAPHDADRLAVVHDLAAEYAALPAEQRNTFLFEVCRLTRGYDRFRVACLTPPEHPMFASLMALLDGLIAADDRAVRTNRGIFDRTELVTASASISPSRVGFPVAVRNGTAIFPSHTGPTITPFRVVRPDEVKRPASMWGDDDE